MIRLRGWLLVWLLAGSMSQVLADAADIRVLTLQHRSAAEMQALLQPHLADEVRISQQGQRLVLSGAADRLDALQALISQLDQPLQSWQVYFARGQVDPAVRADNRVRQYSTRRSQLTRLQLREGSPASLEQGFWVPVTQVQAGHSEQGYQWLAGGIWVEGQAVGDQVLLTFSTRQLQLDGRVRNPVQPGFAGQGQAGVLALQPGQWLTLGRESQLAASAATDASTRRYSTGRPDEFYSLCVEPIDQPSCQP